MRAFVVTSGLLLCAGSGAAQQVRARVVDEFNRQPVAGVTVRLVNSSGDTLQRAPTGTDGFFTLRAPSAGAYVVSVQRIGYAEQRVEITVGAADLTLPAFVLRTDAVSLSPVEVEARARGDNATSVGFTRSSHMLSGSKLNRLEQQGGKTLTAVRQLGGVRLRTLKSYRTDMGETIQNYICMESVRRMATMAGVPPASACQPVVLIMDGVPVGDPFSGLRSIALQDIESLEYYSPVEAGYRFGLGAGAVGALVVFSRGRGPHVNVERNKK